MTVSALRQALTDHLGRTLTPEVAAAIEQAATVPAKEIGIQFHGGDEDSGQVFAVETIAPSGHELASHRHDHGHLSVLASGVAEVTVGEDVQILRGPCVVSIPADTFHRVRALTDVYWYCLWSDHLAPKEKAAEYLMLYAGETV